MQTNKPVPLFLALGLLMAPVVSPATGVYKWVDASGVVHFSQDRPPDHKAERLEIKVRPSSPGPVSEAPGETDKEAAAQKGKPPQGKPTLSPEEQARVDGIRAENCRKAKRNLHTLQTYPMITSVDENGKTIRLDDTQKQAKIEATQKLIDEYCK